MSELPIEVSTGTVHGRFIVAFADGDDVGQDPDATIVQGKIVFSPGVPYSPLPVTSEGPATMFVAPVTGVLDLEGYLCTPHPLTGWPMYRGVKLVATDDADLSVTGWTWTATYQLESAAANVAISAHSFALPSGTSVDLSSLVKIPTSPGYGLPQAEAAVLRAEAIAQSIRDDADNGVFNGEAATVEVGTVASGTTAEVVNVGDEQHAILNITLEKGDKGDTGTGVPDAGAALQVMRMDSGGIATEWVTPSKAIVGLSNVDNTSDANKPISAATQTALNSKADVTALVPKIAEQAVQSDYVAQLEARSPHNAVQLVKVDTGEALQVAAHSATGAFSTHLIEGTNAGSGRDDYRIVGDIYSGKLPTATKTYTDLTNTGTFVSTAEQFAYTTQIGATITANVVIPFAGAEVRFYPYKDNRGGVWRFTLAGQITDVSTWAAASAQESNGFLVSPPGIPKGTHVLKAEFLGDDPAHAPSSGAGTSRGWLARTPGTNQSPGQYDVLKYPDLSAGWAQGTKQGVESNREFAWWFKRAGTAQTAEWVPYHTADTAFNAEPTRFFDGDRELNIFRMTAGEALDLSGSFKMVQHVYGRNTAEPTVNLIDVWTTTTIHPSGRMTIEGKIRVNLDIEVTHPYVIMNPLNSSVFDTVISPVGNVYPNTVAQEGTNTWLPESDWGESWLFLSSSQGDQAAAFRYNNPVETTRRGGAGKPAEANRAWLEHRTGGTILKHYQKLWATGAIIPAGTVHRFSGDYVHAVIPNAFGELAKA